MTNSTVLLSAGAFQDLGEQAASTLTNQLIGTAQDNFQIFDGQLLDTFGVQAVGDSLYSATHVLPARITLLMGGAETGQPLNSGAAHFCGVPLPKGANSTAMLCDVLHLIGVVAT